MTQQFFQSFRPGRAISTLGIALAAGVISTGQALAAPSNIAPSSTYCWGENIGFANLRDAGSPPTSSGVFIGGSILSGYAWGENVGWIFLGSGTPSSTQGQYSNLDGSDVGVNIDANDDLFGLAWGENIGWVNFDTRATLSSVAMEARVDRVNNRLRGFVWGENVGWINLEDSKPAVAAPCVADFSGNGQASIDDVFLFIGAWFNRDPRCDVDRDGVISIDDVFVFIAIWFQGC